MGGPGGGGSAVEMERAEWRQNQGFWHAGFSGNVTTTTKRGKEVLRTRARPYLSPFFQKGPRQTRTIPLPTGSAKSDPQRSLPLRAPGIGEGGEVASHLHMPRDDHVLGRVSGFFFIADCAERTMEEERLSPSPSLSLSPSSGSVNYEGSKSN